MVSLESLADLFTKCLKTSRFPEGWKRANLVLLPKKGCPPEYPLAYPLICKVFERDPKPDRVALVLGSLATPMRSSVYAVLHIHRLCEASTSRGGVAITVSVDIENAFTSVPWSAIRQDINKGKKKKFFTCTNSSSRFKFPSPKFF